MRLRRLCAAVTALAAVLTVAGCRSNVGVAATIDGHRVSETQVTSYLTSDAAPVQITGSDGTATSIAPRPFVLNILIRYRLFLKLLSKTPSGTPTKAQIGPLISQYTKGSTVDAVVEKLGAKGYTHEFNRTVVEVQQFATVLNTEVQRGVNVNKIATALKFPVSVNPRYGKWDKSAFDLDTSTSAGVPGFVDLQPTPTTGSSAAAAPGN